MPTRRGLLIILSSPSGAGKSTLAKRLRSWDETIGFSVSATTRPARPGETDGVDYHFKTHEAFQEMVAQGEMLEHAEVFGNHYGTPAAPVLASLDAGRDMLFDIDWQGGQQIRNSARSDDVVSIFLLPPSIAELHRRLESRGQDSADTIARRMARSRDEISHWAEYDHVLVNNNLDGTEQELRAIITSERLRRSRQLTLNDKVRELNAEFEAAL